MFGGDPEIATFSPFSLTFVRSFIFKSEIFTLSLIVAVYESSLYKVFLTAFLFQKLNDELRSSFIVLILNVQSLLIEV